MSQTTEDLTRSELRAIRGHYRRRVYIAFLIPALVAVALGWLLFQDEDAQSGEPSQVAPRTTLSGPITNEVVSKNCVAALQEASRMLDRAAQALKDWRLHAKALTDYQEGKISLAEARQRWAKTTKVGLAGADRFDKQAEVYKKAATTWERSPWRIRTARACHSASCPAEGVGGSLGIGVASLMGPAYDRPAWPTVDSA